jgi:hypothetical protein
VQLPAAGTLVVHCWMDGKGDALQIRNIKI